MFQFPRLTHITYRFNNMYIEFSHSDISGSMHNSYSPKLFAGNHVLHRFWIPRDPLHAVNFLNK